MSEAPKPQNGLTAEQMQNYLLELAKRIDAGEKIKLVLAVEANNIAGMACYGHSSMGSVFLQMEDCIFTQRFAFVSQQLSRGSS